MIVQSPERPIEPMNQFFRRTIDGLTDRRGVVGHGDWRAAFEPRFHHATFVVATAFAGVLVSEMHFHSRDMRAETFQRALDRRNY